jgi:hypothetical protein
MGYTHYWEEGSKPLTDAKKMSSIKAVRSFLKWANKDMPNILADGHGTKDTNPVIDADKKYVAFNGIGDESHEGMVFEEEWDGQFAFCKTARKNYDAIAVASLCVYKHHLGDALSFTSDGDRGELREGYELYVLHCLKSRKTQKSIDELFIEIRKPEFPQDEVIEEMDE